jgi:hypothetical protein
MLRLIRNPLDICLMKKEDARRIDPAKQFLPQKICGARKPASLETGLLPN